MGRTSPRGATLRSLRRFLPDVSPFAEGERTPAPTELTYLPEYESFVSWYFPWPTGATTNSLYVGMGRRRRLSEAAQSWRDQVIRIVRQYYIDVQRPIALPPGRLGFTLTYWPPNERAHDPSNLLKLAEDSVMAAFGFGDDSRIWDTRAIRCEARPEAPTVLILLRTLEGQN